MIHIPRSWWTDSNLRPLSISAVDALASKSCKLSSKSKLQYSRSDGVDGGANSKPTGTFGRGTFSGAKPILMQDLVTSLAKYS